MGRKLAFLILLSTLVGCDSRDTVQPDPSTEPTPTTSPASVAGSIGSTTSPTTQSLMASTLPSTNPATSQPSTQHATSRSADPLATPSSALTYFISLIQRKQVASIDAITAVLVEAPPDDQLVPQLNHMRRQFLRGAKWEIVGEPYIRGAAAGVVYRTINANGTEEFAPVLLLQLYDRWKIVMGELSPKKYTVGEKEDMVSAMNWAQERVKQLLAAKAATQPATTAPKTPAAPALQPSPQRF